MLHEVPAAWTEYRTAGLQTTYKFLNEGLLYFFSLHFSFSKPSHFGAASLCLRNIEKSSRFVRLPCNIINVN